MVRGFMGCLLSGGSVEQQWIDSHISLAMCCCVLPGTHQHKGHHYLSSLIVGQNYEPKQAFIYKLSSWWCCALSLEMNKAALPYFLEGYTS